MIDWTPDKVQFMKDFIPGHTEGEIRAEFLNRFGIVLTEGAIGNFKHRHGIKSGTHGGCYLKGSIPFNKGKKMRPDVYERVKDTMFKKGQPPVNHREVGSERVNVDGYIELKIAEPNKWKLKQRVIWERETGERLTSNDVIVMLDGNKLNVDISNLRKLTRAELIRFNQMNYKSDDIEAMDAAVKLAKIKTRIGKARRGENEKEAR